jgi:hypothetical protein
MEEELRIKGKIYKRVPHTYFSDKDKLREICASCALRFQNCLSISCKNSYFVEVFLPTPTPSIGEEVEGLRAEVKALEARMAALEAAVMFMASDDERI